MLQGVKFFKTQRVKKAIVLAMALALLASALFACGARPGGGDTAGGAAQENAGNQSAAPAEVSLRVWASQDEQANLKSMCDAFAAANPDTKYTFEYGVVSEADARSRYSEDPAAAADVFMLANDHLREMAKNSSLYEVTRNKDAIVSRNVPGSVEAASYNEQLYAYPMTADNGYFLYYDKSVFSEDDVQSFEKMLEVAEAKGKKVFMDISNGWYLAGFFLGAGCNLSMDENEKQICDFNNADGVAAAEAVFKIASSPAYVDGDDSVLTGGIGGSIAAGVSGTWIAGDIMAVLGDNYGATKLPTFEKAGVPTQMASFGGYKLVGVNSMTNQPVAASDLADWLTNEENQIKRFETRKYGPSNINAQDSPAVKEDMALTALAMQSEFAFPQNDVLENFWGPMEAFGVAMVNHDTSKPIQDLLNDMVKQITAE